jgi:predicted nuclease of predicted toxin-antitoxin system
LRLLLDACVWGGARERLEDAGHECVWVGDWPQDPGDEEILARAAAEGRILVTLDKDFGELAVVQGRHHCGILRLVGLQAREQAVTCGRILKRYGEELQAGALITATRDRVRIRPPGNGE